jgi:hypothetical protein
MSIKFRNEELSPAELSFLKWQYGFDEGDEPFERALWQAIMRAWDADNAPVSQDLRCGQLLRIPLNRRYMALTDMSATGPKRSSQFALDTGH